VQKDIERSRLNGQSGAVLFMDLDKFKEVNDLYGHAAGDRFLVSLTAMLTAQLRPVDFLARWGGDEFAVLLRNLSAEAGLVEAERLLASVRAHRLPLAAAPVSKTVSMGLAFFVNGSSSAEELLHEADTAMYRAKELGGDEVVVLAPKGEKPDSAFKETSAA
jgi:diguanylate cyclase (GGDEF)-like protein